jgi:hypothetical protein
MMAVEIRNRQTLGWNSPELCFTCDFNQTLRAKEHFDDVSADPPSLLKLVLQAS